jgi:hypothetical protein
MSTSGIYPINGNGPQLSDREAALLDSLSDVARESRPASHADLSVAVVAVAKANDLALDLDTTETGFTAVIARDLRVVANKRGTGEETFYCQADNDDLLRMLAEEIARMCGPQIVLPSGGDEGVLVIARN